MTARENFIEVSDNFLGSGLYVLEQLAKFQIRWDLQDHDTALGLIRDSVVGGLMGYPEINTNKHGFDAARGQELLEIKNCSLGTSSLGGTWNDTTLEKAELYKASNVSIALAAWSSHLVLPLFIIYGSNPGIGYWLQERITKRKEGSRSTQSLPAASLLKDYGFKIYCDPRRKQEVLETLRTYRKRTLSHITEDDLLPYPNL